MSQGSHTWGGVVERVFWGGLCDCIGEKVLVHGHLLGCWQDPVPQGLLARGHPHILAMWISAQGSSPHGSWVPSEY